MLVIHGSLISIEVSVIRFFIHMIWKRVPPVCDDFYAVFATVFNAIIEFLVTRQYLMTGAQATAPSGQNIKDFQVHKMTA